MKLGDKLYRFSAICNHDHLCSHSTVECEELTVTKITPKGAWACFGNPRHYQQGPFDKFILIKSKRKYAYTTKEEAWESFQARQAKRLAYSKENLEKAEASFKLSQFTHEEALQAKPIPILKRSLLTL